MICKSRKIGEVRHHAPYFRIQRAKAARVSRHSVTFSGLRNFTRASSPSSSTDASFDAIRTVAPKCGSVSSCRSRSCGAPSASCTRWTGNGPPASAVSAGCGGERDALPSRRSRRAGSRSVGCGTAHSSVEKSPVISRGNFQIANPPRTPRRGRMRSPPGDRRGSCRSRGSAGPAARTALSIPSP